MLHVQTKRVAALEAQNEKLEEEKKELATQVGDVDVRYEEMQAEYRKLRARLEKASHGQQLQSLWAIPTAAVS